jgi:hypothetical protein
VNSFTFSASRLYIYRQWWEDWRWINWKGFGIGRCLIWTLCMPRWTEENGEELSQDSVPAQPRTRHLPNTRGKTQHYISLHICSQAIGQGHFSTSLPYSNLSIMGRVAYVTDEFCDSIISQITANQHALPHLFNVHTHFTVNCKHR